MLGILKVQLSQVDHKPRIYSTGFQSLSLYQKMVPVQASCFFKDYYLTYSC